MGNAKLSPWNTGWAGKAFRRVGRGDSRQSGRHLPAQQCRGLSPVSPVSPGAIHLS